MLVGKPLDTFQLDYQDIFDKDIGKVLSNGMALVSDCKGKLRK